MRGIRLVLIAILALASCGCVFKKMAIRSVANALSKSGDTFSSDEDPQLIREALPFALKTYESLLVQAPTHQGLLVATAAGFTSYSQGFIARDAELLEEENVAAAELIRRRAQRLDVRARDYALRALDVAHPGLAAALRAGHLDGLKNTGPEDVPAMFWAGASWGAAIAVFKNDTDLLSDLPAVKALLARVLLLNATYESGTAHQIMMNLEASLAGGSMERAESEYALAVAASGGLAAAPHVTFAESVCVQRQDRAAFLAALDKALAIAPNARRNLSVSNQLAQDRARWLKARVDELFLE